MIINTGREGSRCGRCLAIIACALILAACADSPQQHNNACAGQAQSTERLFLQQLTDHSAMIKWRGRDNFACVGTSPGAMDRLVAANIDADHKLAYVNGLTPDTRYYYAIGGGITKGEPAHFRTAPTTGQLPADGNTHIWILGDSGTETEQHNGQFTHRGEAEAVKQGFLVYNRKQADNEPLDLLLLLGDNAYVEGTDQQWQEAFFEMYPNIVSNTVTWPTIGNHEMGGAPIDICNFVDTRSCKKGPVIKHSGGISESSDPASYDSDGDGPDAGGLPYLRIFSLPDKGQAGGVASGTEQYYAFDHGNVHIVSLDSQLSNRDPAQRKAMRDWLVDDLGQNTQDWTIVIFHHPPYSKGKNHDSDRERAEIDMRETFAPVFEDHGVDVVYSGHSHSYERSWYLNGHHGLSSSFDASQHAELNSRGEPALGQAYESYRQVSPGSGSDDRTVYTVTGSAGKTDKLKPCKDGRRYGCTLPDWLLHPAHRTFDASITGARKHGLARRGSVVLDIGKTRLTSLFIDEHGEVLDYFVIER